MTLHNFQIEKLQEAVRQSFQIDCYKGKNSQKYFHIQRNSFYLEVNIVPEHLPFYDTLIHVLPITSFSRKPMLNIQG